MRDAPIYGLALTGGYSTRMGRDKATLSYADQPQLARLMALLESVCARAFVSARHDQQDTLRQHWPMIADTASDIGPMAGLLAAQQTHPHAAWLVVACDLPLLDEATLNPLLSARDTQHDSLAFIMDDTPQPMCSLWEPMSALRVTAAHQTGHHSLRRLLTEPHTRLLTPSQPHRLRNINTLADYHELQNLLAASPR